MGRFHCVGAQVISRATAKPIFDFNVVNVLAFFRTIQRQLPQNHAWR
jgi:hypothetical protein